MKKLFVCAIFYMAGAFITAHADSLTLINHYGKSLNFRIEQGRDNEVGLDSNFALDNYMPAFARQINRVPYQCEPENSPITVYFYDPSSDKKQPNDGYFGAGRGCGFNENNVDVRPYVGRGINYSVANNDSSDVIITFCTPTEFSNHGGICP